MGKTPKEKAKLMGTAVKNVDMAATSVAFIFLSNLGGNLKNIFTTHRDVFQYTAFILTAIGLAVSSVRLAFTPNKNLGKVQNLIGAIAQFIPAAVMLFAAATLGPVVSTALFFTVIAIDTLTAIGKAIYFGVKATQTDLSKKEEKIFFKEKAKKYAIGAVIGVLFIAAFAITTIAAPYVGISVVAATGITAGIIAALLLFYSIGKTIQQTFFKKEEKAEEENQVDLEKENKEEEENLLIIESEPTTELDAVQSDTPLVVNKPEKTGYWAHIATPKNEREDIEKAIKKHIIKIRGEKADDKENKSFWSQSEKREKKIEALAFLEELLENSRNGIPKSGKITVGNHPFDYQNKEDLIEQIDQYVINTYPGVYQSFFKKIGKVEDLFRQAYQVLRETPLVPEKAPVATTLVVEENKNTIERTTPITEKKSIEPTTNTAKNERNKARFTH